MEITVKVTLDVPEFTAMRLRRLHEKSRFGSVQVTDPLIRGWFLSALLVPEVFADPEPETTSREGLPQMSKENVP